MPINSSHPPLIRLTFYIWLSILTFSAGCSNFANPVDATPALAGALKTTATPTDGFTVAPSQTDRPAPSETPTATPKPSQTPTATHTLTPTVTATYDILRGEVLERSNCRYGPGAPYLYKYGLVVGSNLEVIGRNSLGTWVLVRAIGGDNPCWVKATLMEVNGEVMSVEPTYMPLPPSPYYGPPKGVSADRQGDTVTVFWSPISFRAGDETASPPYLIEAWVCQDGRLTFIPVGSYATAVEIVDEAGCAEPSRGQVLGVEKHGYTQAVEIPWPRPQ